MMGDMQAGTATRRSGSAVTPAGIVRFDLFGTVAFVVSATLSAVFFTGALRVVAVVVAVGLFTVGVVTFLWSYWTAVQRSRTDNIAVVQLYFLASGSTPRDVKRTMNLALAVQAVVGLGTAIARNTTDGRAGSTLAFGILVPMFGLGLNGLWCSKFGRFSARSVRAAENSSDPATIGKSPSVPPSHDEMEQNSPYG